MRGPRRRVLTAVLAAVVLTVAGCAQQLTGLTGPGVTGRTGPAPDASGSTGTSVVAGGSLPGTVAGRSSVPTPGVTGSASAMTVTVPPLPPTSQLPPSNGTTSPDSSDISQPNSATASGPGSASAPSTGTAADTSTARSTPNTATSGATRPSASTTTTAGSSTNPESTGRSSGTSGTPTRHGASGSTTTTAPTRPSRSSTSAPGTTPSRPTLPPIPAAYQHVMGWTGSGKVVALTFDDGPGPYTAQILAILEAKKVPATFCQIGEQVASYPSIERRIVADGDLLCDHSWDHDEHLSERPISDIDREMSRTRSAILSTAGAAPAYYRAPGGDFGNPVKLAASQNHLPLLAWAIDTRDWTRPGTDAIVDSVLDHVTDGAIVLMHDAGGDRSQTVAALPQIIDGLRARGFSFVTPPRHPTT